MCANDCVLVGLDWAESMRQFPLHVTCSYILMHTFFLFNIFWYILTAWEFSNCLFLHLSLSSVYVSASMALKRKSAPSRRNPLRSRASSSSNPTPSSIQFCDEDAWKDFSENFSRWGVHSKHRVILLDFSDINLPTVIYNQGWESLCDILVTCPSMLIQEFYSNMHGLDTSVPLFHTCVWGTRIVVTLDIVSEVLHVSRVEHPDYLVVSVWGLCSKMRWSLLSTSALLIGMIVSLHHVRPFLKVLDSWTWWWLLFCTLFLNITLSQSLVLNFCFPFLSISLYIFPLISFFLL